MEMTFTHGQRRIFIIDEPEASPAPSDLGQVVPTSQTVATPVVTPSASPRVGAPATVTRNGNGHKKELGNGKRKLTPEENARIKSIFCEKNGILQYKDCSEIKKLFPEVGTWSVTGYISYLHRSVRQSRLYLRDRNAYDRWLRDRAVPGRIVNPMTDYANLGRHVDALLNEEERHTPVAFPRRGYAR